MFYISSSGKSNLKERHTTHLLEWPKPTTPTTPVAGEDVEQQELSFSAGGMQNGSVTLENSLTVSCKTKHTFAIWFSNGTPWYLPKGVKNLCPHKNLHRVVYISLIITDKTWKQPRCPLGDEWINKLSCVQSGEYYSVLEMSFQVMKRHGEKLSACY